MKGILWNVLWCSISFHFRISHPYICLLIYQISYVIKTMTKYVNIYSIHPICPPLWFKPYLREKWLIHRLLHVRCFLRTIIQIYACCAIQVSNYINAVITSVKSNRDPGLGPRPLFWTIKGGIWMGTYGSTPLFLLGWKHSFWKLAGSAQSCIRLPNSLVIYYISLC